MLRDSIDLHCESCCVLCPCAGSHTVCPWCKKISVRLQDYYLIKRNYSDKLWCNSPSTLFCCFRSFCTCILTTQIVWNMQNEKKKTQNSSQNMTQTDTSCTCGGIVSPFFMQQSLSPSCEERDRNLLLTVCSQQCYIALGFGLEVAIEAVWNCVGIDKKHTLYNVWQDVWCHYYQQLAV